MSLSSWLAEATPDRREVAVCLDRRLVSKLVALQKAVESKKTTIGDSAEERRELAEVEAKVAEKTHVLVFEGLGWGPWRELLAQYPPQKDQIETFQRAVRLAFMPHALENLGFDAETFVPAAIAASSVDPKISVDEAADLLAKAPPGVIDRIWSAVLEVNLAGADDPFVPGAGSAGARPSVRRSRPRSPSGSRAPSSSVA